MERLQAKLKDLGDRMRVLETEKVKSRRMFEGALKTRSVKLYEEVIEKLDEYASTHPEKIQEIVNTAIIEYIEARSNK